MKTFNEYLNEGRDEESLLTFIKELEEAIMRKQLGSVEMQKKAQADLKILKDAHSIMWKWEPIIKGKR
jgi:hypothetical protein